MWCTCASMGHKYRDHSRRVGAGWPVTSWPRTAYRQARSSFPRPWARAARWNTDASVNSGVGRAQLPREVRDDLDVLAEQGRPDGGGRRSFPRPSRGPRTSNMRDVPAPSPTASSTVARSSPARRASSSASAAARVCTVTSRFAMNFIFDPLPNGPTSWQARVMARTTGAARCLGRLVAAQVGDDVPAPGLLPGAAQRAVEQGDLARAEELPCVLFDLDRQRARLQDDQPGRPPRRGRRRRG